MKLLIAHCDRSLGFCHAAICPRPWPPILLFSKRVNAARHARGTDARSPAGDCTPAVNRRCRLFKTARERADRIAARVETNRAETRIFSRCGSKGQTHPSADRRWDGARFSSIVRKNRCGVRSRLAEPCKIIRSIQLRMGVHSGPVNRITDVNEKTNIAGSGINVAQRVLDCGDAGHILLSAHVAEDLAEYRHWQPYLHDLGRVRSQVRAAPALV